MVGDGAFDQLEMHKNLGIFQKPQSSYLQLLTYITMRCTKATFKGPGAVRVSTTLCLQLPAAMLNVPLVSWQRCPSLEDSLYTFGERILADCGELVAGEACLLTYLEIERIPQITQTLFTVTEFNFAIHSIPHLRITSILTMSQTDGEKAVAALMTRSLRTDCSIEGRWASSEVLWYRPRTVADLGE